MTTDTSRIESLEKQFRLLEEKVDSLIAALSVDSIHAAREFQVVNEEGMVVAAIGSQNSSGAFTLFNKSGERMASISVDGSGAMMRICNGEGKSVVSIYGNESGGAMGLYRAGSDPSTLGSSSVLLATASEGGVLRIFNDEDSCVASISPEGDSAELNIYNKEKQQLTVLHGGNLTLLNGDKKLVAAIHTNADGGGDVLTFNSKGKLTSRNP